MSKPVPYMASCQFNFFLEAQKRVKSWGLCAAFELWVIDSLRCFIPTLWSIWHIYTIYRFSMFPRSNPLVEMSQNVYLETSMPFSKPHILMLGIIDIYRIHRLEWQTRMTTFTVNYKNIMAARTDKLSKRADVLWSFKTRSRKR